MKRLLLITGALACALLVAQLVLGLLLLQGQARFRIAHQHTGILTVAVSLFYIGWSMAAIGSSGRPAGATGAGPRRRNPG